MCGTIDDKLQTAQQAGFIAHLPYSKRVGMAPYLIFIRSIVSSIFDACFSKQVLWVRRVQKQRLKQPVSCRELSSHIQYNFRLNSRRSLGHLKPRVPLLDTDQLFRRIVPQWTAIVKELYTSPFLIHSCYYFASGSTRVLLTLCRSQPPKASFFPTPTRHILLPPLISYIIISMPNQSLSPTGVHVGAFRQDKSLNPFSDV